MRYAQARRVARRMNATEAEYEKLFLGGKPHGFEEITLRLGPDVRLTPDFWTLGADDVLEFHEVKGAFIRDDAIGKLRIAAERYPLFRFKLFQKQAKKLGGGWRVVPIGQPDAAVA